MPSPRAATELRPGYGPRARRERARRRHGDGQRVGRAAARRHSGRYRRVRRALIGSAAEGPRGSGAAGQRWSAPARQPGVQRLPERFSRRRSRARAPFRGLPRHEVAVGRAAALTATEVLQGEEAVASFGYLLGLPPTGAPRRLEVPAITVPAIVTGSR